MILFYNLLYTVEVRNRFKGLDLIDRVPDELWTEVPRIKVFSNETVLCIRWPKYWSFSFDISPSQTVDTKIRLIIFFAAKDGEAVYSQQKQDRELTVAQIMNSLLPNSD